MQKFWSILFGGVLAACLVLTAVAPLVPGWWLPANIASYGGEVDFLFYLILAFTAFFFVLTEAILVCAMWKFGSRPDGRSTYVHGNHKLEVFWTAVPAGILLFIAFSQISTWERIKYHLQMPKPDQILQVTARQWEWRLRYPKDVVLDEGEARQWAETSEFDDLRQVNEIHTWKDAHVMIYLKTQDVIHSLYLPNLRLKQDALPGKTIPMWFRVTQANVRFLPDPDDPKNPKKGTLEYLEPKKLDDHWEFACAELCGGRHFAMRGRLYVHEDRKSFDAWMDHANALQRSREPESAPAEQTASAAGVD